VYLIAGGDAQAESPDDFKNLGGLKGNKGDQQYTIPKGVDIEKYGTVLIWCRAFSVAFGTAPLQGS
jgi:hypothetical protein